MTGFRKILPGCVPFGLLGLFGAAPVQAGPAEGAVDAPAAVSAALPAGVFSVLLDAPTAMLFAISGLLVLFSFFLAGLRRSMVYAVGGFYFAGLLALMGREANVGWSASAGHGGQSLVLPLSFALAVFAGLVLSALVVDLKGQIATLLRVPRGAAGLGVGLCVFFAGLVVVGLATNGKIHLPDELSVLGELFLVAAIAVVVFLSVSALYLGNWRAVPLAGACLVLAGSLPLSPGWSLFHVPYADLIMPPYSLSSFWYGALLHQLVVFFALVAADGRWSVSRRNEQADKLSTNFVSVLSHELRTPLNGVLGFAGLLETTSLSQNQREYTAMIKTSGQALMSLVNDLLDLSRIETDQLEITPSLFEPGELIRGVVNKKIAEADAKGLELAYTIDSSVPRLMVGDAARISQVLEKLLDNAIKFTGRGGAEIRVRQTGERRRGDPLITFEVRDTGIGIAPQKLEKIFLPFSLDDDPWSRKQGGAGLGLTLSRALAFLMEGEIEVESEENQGCLFSLTLPLEAVDEDEDQAASPSLKGRILVVADNEIARSSLCDQTLILGADVQAVLDEGEAVDALIEADRRKQRFDAVIIDQALYGARKGNSASRESLRSLKSTKAFRDLVVIMTCRTLKDGIELDPDEDVALFVHRPIDQDVLRSGLVPLLERPAKGFGFSKSGAKPRPDTQNGCRVLVLTDEARSDLSFVAPLHKDGLSVHVSVDKMSLISKLGARPYDLLIIDYALMGQDGCVLAETVRSLEAPFSDIPMLALVGAITPFDVPHLIHSPFNGIVSDPFAAEDLVRKIKRCVDMRGADMPSLVNDEEFAGLVPTHGGDASWRTFRRRA